MEYNLKVYKASKAHEYESFRNLPKFSKPNLACIHPSTRQKVMRPANS
jgi:hypothetical protein